VIDGLFTINVNIWDLTIHKKNAQEALERYKKIQKTLQTLIEMLVVYILEEMEINGTHIIRRNI
jgi:hypothetical protein